MQLSAITAAEQLGFGYLEIRNNSMLNSNIINGVVILLILIPITRKL